MKRSKYSDCQIIAILNENEAGVSVAGLCYLYLRNVKRYTPRFLTFATRHGHIAGATV